MILGVNGIRLVVKRSGVARCIEALLRDFGIAHPFDEIRVIRRFTLRGLSIYCLLSLTI